MQLGAVQTQVKLTYQTSSYTASFVEHTLCLESRSTLRTVSLGHTRHQHSAVHLLGSKDPPTVVCRSLCMAPSTCLHHTTEAQRQRTIMGCWQGWIASSHAMHGSQSLQHKLTCKYQGLQTVLLLQACSVTYPHCKKRIVSTTSASGKQLGCQVYQLGHRQTCSVDACAMLLPPTSVNFTIKH